MENRMKQLIDLLNAASRAYYQENREIMPDFEYDRLYDELKRLEESTGITLSQSPTVKVGYAAVDSLVKVRHASPMLSLDKTKEVSRLAAFLQAGGGLLSFKMDGLTVAVTYENGSLVSAVTRGNGEIGEDITHNARVFRNLPLTVGFGGTLVVRGEAVIAYAEFERINAALPEGEQYKNPRNLTSGTVRALKSETLAGRGVTFFAFAAVRADGADFGDSKAASLVFLQSLGFDTVIFERVTAETAADAVEKFKAMAAELGYATDGLVVTLDSMSLSESLGVTSKFPRDSIAFKWADETAETTVTRVEWNTSRTGLINPVAVFEPVELEGTEVSRASVHNAGIVKEMGLRAGCRVVVYKANMIIPQIAENLTPGENAEIPAECPACGGPTSLLSVRDGTALYCLNPGCRAQLVRSLVHFASRDAMNIEGLSTQTIEKFVGLGWLGDFMDIYSLGGRAAEIAQLEGFGEKSAANLTAAIERSKSAPLANFLNAVGISQIGLAGAKLLCRRFGDDLAKIAAATREELTEIDGFGEITAGFVTGWFANARNAALIEKAAATFDFPKPEEPEGAPKPLSGMVFVITGGLNAFKNRKALSDLIENLGGRTAGAVSSATTYLINNDSASASAKNKKAHELGVKIITEDEFIDSLTSKGRL